MSADLIKVLMLLGICMLLFVLNKPRMDIVALLAIVCLSLTGVVTLPQALAGFSDPNVILIAALFVIGEALVRTGVTCQVGGWLIRQAGNHETRLMVLLMLVVAGLGATMSSTGVVGVFIPVVMSMTRHLKVSPSRFMMPLSFAGLISGMTTLVATPPNMVMDSALRAEGLPGFTFFSFTPVGVMVLGLGIAYMLVARRWIGGGEAAKLPKRRGLSHFVQEYHLQQRGYRLLVGPQSPMQGKKLAELNLRREHGANVVAVERPGRFRSELLHPEARTELRAGDVLLVDFFEPVDASAFCGQRGLSSLPLRGPYFNEHSQDVGMAEVLIPPESSRIGKSVLEQNFRTQRGLNVVGLRRQGKAFEGRLLEEKWKMGDVVLVAGAWKNIRRLQSQTGEFVVLSLPPEADEVAPAMARMPYALAILLLMIVLMVGGWVPNVIAALVACLLMGLFRCVDLASAYKAIHWQSLILIAGMIPFAHALQSTGGVDLAVESLMGVMQGVGPGLLLGSLFLLTAVIGLFISNTATAVLMAPVAISLAHHVQASPLPFAMTVAIACSAAFMTPVSSPVNTLVVGPGNYRFMDFVKVGVPFTLIILILTVIVVPWLFPL